MVYCLFDLILFIPVNIFSVKSYQYGSFLGWTGTKPDLMCLACHVYFLQPCGHLLGKGWPLGSVVCDVFLLFLSLSHTIPCPGSCVLPNCIDSLPLPRLKHSTTGYCTRILCGEQMKVSDYCYDLGVKGLGQYILQMLTWIPLIIFVRGCPYIPKWFLKVGPLNWRFQSTTMSVGSKVKVSRIGPTVRNMNFCILW